MPKRRLFRRDRDEVLAGGAANVPVPDGEGAMVVYQGESVPVQKIVDELDWYKARYGGRRSKQ